MSLKYKLRFGLFILMIFTIGLFSTGSYFLISGWHFTQVAKQTVGEIIECRRGASESGPGVQYIPIVRFTAEERQILFSGQPQATRCLVGTLVKISYNPQNLNQAALGTPWASWPIKTLMTFIGFLACLYVLYSIYARTIKVARNKEVLISGGKIIECNSYSILSWKVFVFGEKLYTVQGQWRDPKTNQLYIFESEFVWFNPEPYLKDKKLQVYVNPSDFTQYYVSLPSLLLQK